MVVQFYTRVRDILHLLIRIRLWVKQKVFGPHLTHDGTVSLLFWICNNLEDKIEKKLAHTTLSLKFVPITHLISEIKTFRYVQIYKLIDL